MLWRAFSMVASQKAAMQSGFTCAKTWTMNMSNLPYKRSDTQERNWQSDRLMRALLPKKRQANCLPRVRNLKNSCFNRRFRPSPSIFSQFVDQGKPLCSPSSRSVGIERYPRNEQMCQRSDIQHLPSLSRLRPADSLVG